MVHIPRNVRPIPTGAVGSRSVAPISSAAPLGVGLPTDMQRNVDKPIVEKRKSGYKRSFATHGIRDKVAISAWDVNPFKIIEDM